jgi:hypothetical protein
MTRLQGSRPSRTIKSVTASQRAACNLVFYRYESPDIVKTEESNASNTRFFSGGVASAQGNLTAKRVMTIDNDVVRATVTKSKSSNSGTFSITLKRGKVESGEKLPIGQDVNYLSAINPGDWVCIYIKKAGSINTRSTKPDSGLKMIGIVENVRFVELDDPNSGNPRLEYIITGRDFGKVFDMNIFFNPLFATEKIKAVLGATFNSNIDKVIKNTDKLSNGRLSPDQVVKAAIDFYLGGTLDEASRTNQNWYIPSTLATRLRPNQKAKGSQSSFVDVLDTSQIGLHKYDRQFNLSTNNLLGGNIITKLPAEGTVWSVLEYLANKVINEIYTDLVIDRFGNLVPGVICRQIPFSGKGEVSLAGSLTKFTGSNKVDPISSNEKTFFTELPRVNVTSDVIRQKNVGKSDFERVNHVIVTPRIFNEKTSNLLYASVINVASIQRYGLKTIQSQTDYVFGPADNPSSYCEKCTSLLTDWFFLSHLLYNGTLELDGIDRHFELGQNLYITDIQQLWHIEGYTHAYNQQAAGSNSFITTLNVSRGQLFDGKNSRFIDGTANTQSLTIVNSNLENIRN